MLQRTEGYEERNSEEGEEREKEKDRKGGGNEAKRRAESRAAYLIDRTLDDHCPFRRDRADAASGERRSNLGAARHLVYCL